MPRTRHALLTIRAEDELRLYDLGVPLSFLRREILERHRYRVGCRIPELGLGRRQLDGGGYDRPLYGHPMRLHRVEKYGLDATLMKGDLGVGSVSLTPAG